MQEHFPVDCDARKLCDRFPQAKLALKLPISRQMVLLDIFIDQDSPNAMYAKAGLDAKGIVAKAFEALGQNLRGDVVKLVR